MPRRAVATVGALILVVAAAGCSSGDAGVDAAQLEELTTEATSLGDEIASLREQLASAEKRALQAEAAVRQNTDNQLEVEGECPVCDRPATGPDERTEWVPESPAVIHPPLSGYLTNEDVQEVWVLAPESWTVTMNEITAEPGQRWAGNNRVFSAEVPLTEGLNTITIAGGSAAEQVLYELQVTRDSDFLRRHGRILDNRIDPEAGWLWLAGVDFGEIDLEPDYGQGDFEPGAVVVEFHPVSPNALAIIDPFNVDGLVLAGDEIRDIFYDTSTYRPMNSDPHTWVWSLLIHADEIVQMESVPLGD